ncbi:uncharacterized protein BDV17DRAFT_263102 [Aspergillus undulatus]|uniref:uncharacterized protein n=1 Tax=Aspergillus undulatus TaxID=1810928 RepID=UPI003CCD6CF7
MISCHLTQSQQLPARVSFRELATRYKSYPICSPEVFFAIRNNIPSLHSQYQASTMTRELSFDIRFDNIPAHDEYGDGKELADRMREIYKGKGLEFPNDFDSTLTTPPVHFMQVFAPDDVDVDALRRVNVPSGLDIEILELSY